MNHMMLRQFLALALALALTLFLCLAMPVWLGSASADSADGAYGGEQPVIRQLERQLERFQTFSADVRQVIVESGGGVLEESRIRFRLKRPDGFYWETIEPWPELIVTDGESLWHYEPDLWQLTIDDWQADESELAARLLSGQTAALAEDYDVSLHPASNAERQEFVLTPHDPVSTYVQVTLYFEADVLDSIQIAHSNGQQTVWEFQNPVLDKPIDDSAFRFSPPDDEDIEVIDNRMPRS